MHNWEIHLVPLEDNSVIRDSVTRIFADNETLAREYADIIAHQLYCSVGYVKQI